MSGKVGRLHRDTGKAGKTKDRTDNTDRVDDIGGSSSYTVSSRKLWMTADESVNNCVLSVLSRMNI